jgi:hypothetical protein
MSADFITEFTKLVNYEGNKVRHQMKNVTTKNSILHYVYFKMKELFEEKCNFCLLLNLPFL